MTPSNTEPGQPTNSSEPCAHCASAYSMAVQARENRIQAPEALRAALLLGIVIGLRDDLEEMEACADCKAHIEQMKEMVFGAQEGAESEEASVAPATP